MEPTTSDRYTLASDLRIDILKGQIRMVTATVPHSSFYVLRISSVPLRMKATSKYFFLRRLGVGGDSPTLFQGGGGVMRDMHQDLVMF